MKKKILSIALSIGLISSMCISSPATVAKAATHTHNFVFVPYGSGYSVTYSSHYFWCTNSAHGGNVLEKCTIATCVSNSVMKCTICGSITSNPQTTNYHDNSHCSQH